MVESHSLAACWRAAAALPQENAAAGLALVEDVERRLPAECSLPDCDQVRDFLGSVFALSPHILGLVRKSPVDLVALLAVGPDRHIATSEHALRAQIPVAMAGAFDATMMTALRRHKAQASLAIALADIGGLWSTDRVAREVTRLADVTSAVAVDALIAHAVKVGDLLSSDVATEGPTHTHGDSAASMSSASGYIVLAMGKHGACELNYSSDIDLIVFFDPERAKVRADLSPQTLFVRLTRRFVKLMQEQTADGYVFRVDLRLRPDPNSTQVALTVEAALQYYEAYGQNWERAALIKARPIAGDLQAGARMLDELRPYIWRKYLDYAAIADVHAMKRQIHALRGFSSVKVAGHNIKLGRGGIREIEFFAQTQQLIAGGRQAELRCRRTDEALHQLAIRGWISHETATELTTCYWFLRHVEHRIQMVADAQSHTIPHDPEAGLRLARFSGFEAWGEFEDAVQRSLRCVERHYEALFERVPTLATGQGNLVFAGDADDPGTLETLAQLGFSDPRSVVQTVRGWHFGRYAAVASARARERLTELQPRLINAIAKTAAPDAALASFDRFLAELPAGVQLFSLLRSNPSLLQLIADIMGSAPRLARILSRRRRTIEAVLDPGFVGSLPSADECDRIIAGAIGDIQDTQEVLDRVRGVASEQAFLIGVKLLMGVVDGEAAGRAYAMLAEKLIRVLHRDVVRAFEDQHGQIPGSRGSAIVAMGKLGSQEMSAASDVDLILIYDAPLNAMSDGGRPLATQLYYARLTQRLVSAISAPTAEGTLYDVDMRLRPSGNSGPVATSLESFVAYQASQAWTWERMALTRARVISGPDDLASDIVSAVRDTLMEPRVPAEIRRDVLDMRARVAEEKPHAGPWSLKTAPGSILDLEFLVQCLVLQHAHREPALLQPNTLDALAALLKAEVIEHGVGQQVLESARVLSDLQQLLRLCIGDAVDTDRFPDGLKARLAAILDAPSFEAAERMLLAHQSTVHAAYVRYIGSTELAGPQKTETQGDGF